MRNLRRLLLSLGLAALPLTAHASTLRFSQTAAGNVVATGNTLGLSKQSNANGPGTLDSIGTFITLDALSVDDHPVNLANPWFAGTTYDWTLSGSAAELVLPKDAEVLYAELVWGGSSYYGTEDVLADLDDAVTLGFGGDVLAAAPDPTTALTVDQMSSSGFYAHYYMRTADVTDFVVAHGAGSYDVSGVPATQDSSINTLNAAGWTLVVAYRDSNQPIRNLSVFVGGSFVDEDAVEDYAVSGFCTPPMGDFDGLAVVSAIEGDANLVGDTLSIAQDVAGPFAPLVGANNPVNNFFASQINGADGELDTTGTFGELNHDAFLGLNVSGGRQGWDITHVPVSSYDGQLANGQTEAVLRTSTTGDSFVPTTVALAIGVNAPDFSSDDNAAAAAPASIALDEVATVTITLANDGLVDATDVTLVAPLPTGLALDAFAIDGNPGDADGNPVADADLTSGVDLGTIGPGQSVEVTIDVHAAAEPDDLAVGYVIAPQWSYTYVSCAGQDPQTEPHNEPDVVIGFTPSAGTGGSDSGADGTAGADTAADGTAGAESASASASGTDGDASASASATDTDSASDGGVDGTGSGSAGAGDGNDSGCGCTSDRNGGGAALVLLSLVAIRRRRRGQAVSGG